MVSLLKKVKQKKIKRKKDNEYKVKWSLGYLIKLKKHKIFSFLFKV